MSKTGKGSSKGKNPFTGKGQSSGKGSFTGKGNRGSNNFSNANKKGTNTRKTG